MSNFNPLAKTLVPLIKSSLNAYASRQEAIAQNISNIETEGYKPLKVNFEENLQRELSNKKSVLAKSNPRHMNIRRSNIEIEESLDRDNQSLNIENEMAELAKNQIRFDFAARVLARYYRGIRTAIFGRPS